LVAVALVAGVRTLVLVTRGIGNLAAASTKFFGVPGVGEIEAGDEALYFEVREAEFLLLGHGVFLHYFCDVSMSRVR
jgi:hypothetical protein